MVKTENYAAFLLRGGGLSWRIGFLEQKPGFHLRRKIERRPWPEPQFSKGIERVHLPVA